MLRISFRPCLCENSIHVEWPTLTVRAAVPLQMRRQTGQERGPVPPARCRLDENLPGQGVAAERRRVRGQHRAGGGLTRWGSGVDGCRFRFKASTETVLIPDGTGTSTGTANSFIKQSRCGTLLRSISYLIVSKNP